jgi:hypothetical protein
VFLVLVSRASYFLLEGVACILTYIRISSVFNYMRLRSSHSAGLDIYKVFLWLFVLPFIVFYVNLWD